MELKWHKKRSQIWNENGIKNGPKYRIKMTYKIKKKTKKKKN